MIRFGLAATLATISVNLVPFLAPHAIQAIGPFETKLPADRQIVQVLNRLTFGPRPGDVEAVRRMGLEKWIDLELHPERIAETPALEEMLQPLATLRMDPAQIMKEYAQPVFFQMQQNLTTLLSPEERRRIQNGTAEERTAALMALDPEKRKQVLALVQANVLDGLPDLKKEADEARKEQQQMRQAELQKRLPPMMDLLTPDQRSVIQRGGRDQIKALLDGLDPQKRIQVAAAMPAQQIADFPELRRAGMKERMPMQVVSSDLKAGKLYRAAYSNRQLEEVLTDFWFNHFNVFENKNVQLLNNGFKALISDYERNAIAPHVLGHFKDLVLATAKHPAMLYYLDNWQSMSTETTERMQVGPFGRPLNFNPPPGIINQQPRGLNENYGRELMELHTLGVNGGYTQQDVVEVARCFTGWTVRKAGDPRYQFVDFMHDDGEKTVLGHKIAAGGGEKDGLQVIDILGRQPATAKFISRQLAQRFVADDPPAALVGRMAATFLKTDGDLRAVMQTMFSSPEFLSEGTWQSKIKSPFEMVVSAVRATGVPSIDGFTLAQRIADLGEPLYGKVEPNGYSLTGEGWLGTSDLLGRLNFANALASGKLPGAKVDTSRWDGKDASAIAHDLLSRAATQESLDALRQMEGEHPNPQALAGMVLSSPEFNRR